MLNEGNNGGIIPSRSMLRRGDLSTRSNGEMNQLLEVGLVLLTLTNQLSGGQVPNQAIEERFFPSEKQMQQMEDIMQQVFTRCNGLVLQPGAYQDEKTTILCNAQQWTHPKRLDKCCHNCSCSWG